MPATFLKVGCRLLRAATRTSLVAVTTMAMMDAAAAQKFPKLAPGVLRIVESAPEEKDTVSGPRAVTELVEQAPQWQPNYAPESETLSAIASQITLRRTAWQLEFAYKPMRMLTANVGGSTGRIWYLVYRVRNTGRHLKATSTEDAFGHDKYGVAKVSKSVRFIPAFRLRAHEFGLEYADQVLPAAVRRIHRIEIRDPTIPLYDSISISTQPIKPSSDVEDNSIWGVATWVDVDPRTDFFSVFVQGLTNAYNWDMAIGEGDYPVKTLQLNFWRPGDAVLEHQDEFRVGLPYLEDLSERAKILERYGLDEVEDYNWVYRP